MIVEEERKCSVCGHTLHPGCRNEFGGGGFILTKVSDSGEVRAKTCPNMRKLLVKRYLKTIDPNLLRIPHAKGSTLYDPESNWTGQNLFFPRVHWSVFLSHLKWVAAHLYASNFFIRMTSDMTLVNIYVGNTNVRAVNKEAASVIGNVS